MTQPFRLLLIGDSDSQLLACEALCRFPEHLHVEVTIIPFPEERQPILRRAEDWARLAVPDGPVGEQPALLQFDAIGTSQAARSVISANA